MSCQFHHACREIRAFAEITLLSIHNRNSQAEMEALQAQPSQTASTVMTHSNA